MEASRKPLARVEGRRRLRVSGLTIVWRGTPSLDDWVAYILRAKSKSKNFILADHASERKVKSQDEVFRLRLCPEEIGRAHV